MIPGELYFVIKIPTSAFFISKEGGKKTGAILYKYTHFFLKQSKEKLFYLPRSVRHKCSKLARSLKHVKNKEGMSHSNATHFLLVQLRPCFVASMFSDFVQ